MLSLDSLLQKLAAEVQPFDFQNSNRKVGAESSGTRATAIKVCGGTIHFCDSSFCHPTLLSNSVNKHLYQTLTTLRV
jgi:hypothetical protein